MLAGNLDEKGRVQALPVAALVEFDVIAKNRISQNRIEDIEQLKVDARPMELQTIAAALSLPFDWFARGGGETLSQPIADLLAAVERDARARLQGKGESHGGSDAASHPPAAVEGGS